MFSIHLTSLPAILESLPPDSAYAGLPCALTTWGLAHHPSRSVRNRAYRERPVHHFITQVNADTG